MKGLLLRTIKSQMPGKTCTGAPCSGQAHPRQMFLTASNHEVFQRGRQESQVISYHRDEVKCIFWSNRVEII